jgi:hypothetical protein
MTRPPTPPRWAEALLRLCLPPRDRDTVTGDLLEEYRESVLPMRGRLRAQLWYLRHAISLVPGMVFGVILGIAFGTWNLLVSIIDPLTEDTPFALLTFYGPMFTAWGILGFVTTRRSGRIVDAIKSGAVVGAITVLVFSCANLVRVNLLLDSVQHRLDWQNMMARFHDSGFDSLRAFVNYHYVADSWLKVLTGALIGAAVGVVAGLAARTVDYFVPPDSAGSARRT